MEQFTEYQCAMMSQYFHKVHDYASYWRFKYRFLDKMDIFDACMDAMIKTARSFDSTKGDFGGLLWRSCRNQVKTVIRDNNAQKRKDVIKVSFDSVLIDEEDSTYHDVIGKEDEYHFFLVELGKLSEIEKRCIYLKIVKGMTQTEIGGQIGHTQVEAGRFIRKGLAKMKAYYEEV